MNEVIETNQAPPAIGAYSQAVLSDSFLFISGQSPLDPKTGLLASGEMKGQAIQVMENIKYILAAAQLGFSDVVKTTVFITRMEEFAVVNEVYRGYFGDKLPTRSCVGVASLPKGALVEIEVIAGRKGR